MNEQCGKSVLNWLGKAIERHLTRDLLFATLGSYGMVHEIQADDPNQVIVLASLALLGAPVALRADEREHGGGG